MACKSSLLNIFSTRISHFVTQKVRLKKDHTQKHVSHPGLKKVYHTQNSKRWTTPMTQKKWITPVTQKKERKCITPEIFCLALDF